MISDDIKFKQNQRFQFLYKLYEESNGEESLIYNMREIGKSIGLDEKSCSNIVSYLENEGLIKGYLDGGISITHIGIKEVEYAIQNPDHNTQHFIPINQLNISIGQNIGSPIIANSPGASQSFVLNDGNRTEIINKLQQWKELIKDLNMADKDKQKLESYVEIAEEEVLSEKPKGELLIQCIEKSDKLINLAHNAGKAIAMLAELKAMLGIH